MSDAKILNERIPKEFHDFADVFSETEARVLLPHWLYDHTIDLELNANAPWGPIYNMSAKELEALCELIQEMLGKGFI